MAVTENDLWKDERAYYNLHACTKRTWCYACGDPIALDEVYLSITAYSFESKEVRLLKKLHIVCADLERVNAALNPPKPKRKPKGAEKKERDKKPGNARSVLVGDTEYPSVTAAALELEITPSALAYRCKSPKARWADFRFK